MLITRLPLGPSKVPKALVLPARNRQPTAEGARTVLVPSCHRALLALICLGCLDLFDAGISAAEVDPDNCTWTLLLDQVLPPKSPGGPSGTLRVYPYRSKGKWVHAVGSSPGWNRAGHIVRVERLDYADGRLEGKLRIVCQPDGLVPADQKPVELLVEIAARVDPKLGQSDDSIGGTYRGTRNGQEVSGRLRGHLATPYWQPLDRCLYNLVFYHGLAGGEAPGERRIGVIFEIHDGKVTAARWTRLGQRGGPGESTAFAPGSVEVSMTTVAGEFEIRAPVLGAAEGKPAKYRFHIDGKRVDNLICGEFEATVALPGRPETTHKGAFRGDTPPLPGDGPRAN